MSPGLHRVLKWVGYPVYALALFVVFCYLAFPGERLRPLFVGQSFPLGSWTARVLSVGSVGARPLLGLAASDVRLRLTQAPKRGPRLARAGEAPSEAGPDSEGHTVRLDALSAALSLGALLGAADKGAGGIATAGEIDVRISGLGGEVTFSREALADEDAALRLELDQVEMAKIPHLQDLGPPVKGRLSATVALELPRGRWAGASGEIALSCSDCSLGDGKAKLVVSSNALLAMGVTLPELRLGQLSGELVVDDGMVKLDGLSAKSADLEVHVEGTIKLAETFPLSAVDAYVRFRLSPELKRRDPRLQALEDAVANARRPDGFIGLRISGSFGRPRVVFTKKGTTRGSPRRPSRASVSGGRLGARRSRP